jgi:phosphoribosylformylglycinamidine (FGAM) synthase PurS component
MAARLEIGLRDGLMDAEGANIKRKATDYFGFEIEDIRVIRVLTIIGDAQDPYIHQPRHGGLILLPNGKGG